MVRLRELRLTFRRWGPPPHFPSLCSRPHTPALSGYIVQLVDMAAKCGPCCCTVTRPEARDAPAAGDTRKTATIADVCIGWAESFLSAFGCSCKHVSLCGPVCVCGSHYTITTALFPGARPRWPSNYQTWPPSPPQCCMSKLRNTLRSSCV